MYKMYLPSFPFPPQRKDVMDREVKDTRRGRDVGREWEMGREVKDTRRGRGVGREWEMSQMRRDTPRLQS